jgi:hypothetical protein
VFLLVSIYQNYFAKDKSLRHYTQHLLLALLTLGFLYVVLDIQFDANRLFYFILISYAVDIDGLVSWLVWKNEIPEGALIVDAVKKGKLITAAELATKHHKKLTRLVLHNIFGLIALIFIFLFGLINQNQMVIILSSAALTHFLFDIGDDVVQIGHINNWLWPIRSIKNIFIKF